MTCVLSDLEQWLHKMPANEEETSNNGASLSNLPSHEECGVVFFTGVPVDAFFELTPFLLSLANVRKDEAAYCGGLDVNFFKDGPNKGEVYICLDTPQAATELVSRFPCSVMVGQHNRFPIQPRLSSLPALQRIREQYELQYEEGCPSTPEPPAASPAATAENADDSAAAAKKDGAGERSLVYWLRGLPYETTQADLDRFLAPLQGKIAQLHVGYLSTGECSGNVFVELTAAVHHRAIMDLHNTFIDIAAHTALPPQERPKPRFVEVIAASAQRRAEQLETDARTRRNPTVHHARGSRRGAQFATTTAAAAAAAAPSGAAAPTTSSGAVPVQTTNGNLSFLPATTVNGAAAKQQQQQRRRPHPPPPPQQHAPPPLPQPHLFQAMYTAGQQPQQLNGLTAYPRNSYSVLVTNPPPPQQQPSLPLSRPTQFTYVPQSQQPHYGLHSVIMNQQGTTAGQHVYVSSSSIQQLNAVLTANGVPSVSFYTFNVAATSQGESVPSPMPLSQPSYVSTQLPFLTSAPAVPHPQRIFLTTNSYGTFNVPQASQLYFTPQ